MDDGTSEGRNVTVDMALQCTRLGAAWTRGELGSLMAPLVLSFSPRDLSQMIRNFSLQIADVEPGYRRKVTEKISEHLVGTYQRIRLMAQQGSFSHMGEPIGASAAGFWEMIAGECRSPPGGVERRLRFLKYLLAGFTMFVMREPAHATGCTVARSGRRQTMSGAPSAPSARPSRRLPSGTSSRR